MRSGAMPKLMKRSRMLRDGARKRVTSSHTPRMCSSRRRATGSSWSSDVAATAVAASSLAPEATARGRRRSIASQRRDEGRRHGRGRDAQARAAARGFRSGADAVARVEELSAMAEQPVVVQREQHRHAARRQQSGNLGGQTRQMVHVGHIGLELVDELGRDPRDRRASVRLLVRADVPERVVDPRDRRAHRAARFSPRTRRDRGPAPVRARARRRRTGAQGPWHADRRRSPRLPGHGAESRGRRRGCASDSSEAYRLPAPRRGEASEVLPERPGDRQRQRAAEASFPAARLGRLALAFEVQATPS